MHATGGGPEFGEKIQMMKSQIGPRRSLLEGFSVRQVVFEG